MAESKLANKMKLKPGSRAAVINASRGYLAELNPTDVEVAETLEGQFHWVQIFVKTKAEVGEFDFGE